MTEEPKSETVEHQTSPHLRQRQLCLDQARDLIASAERLLPGDGGYPNIAYHLAILAMEEIGKAGMLGTRAVVKGTLDSGWMDKRLDNHVWKLMWGVWSPSLSGKIEPKAFEEARQFAERTHARRMAGVLSNYTDDARRAPPVSAANHDSCRPDILGSKVLAASTSSPAVDDVRWVGQPPSVECDRLPPG